jgi:integrase
VPLKLYEPDLKHPTWRVRGKYLGVSIERSTGTREKKVASRLLAKWKDDIERGCYAKAEDPTFASAALSYMQAGGENRFLEQLIKHFGLTLLARITQADVDNAAAILFPTATPATRNRHVYTPVSAVLRHGGVRTGLARPKGASGETRLFWLSPEQAMALVAAARARIGHAERRVENALPVFKGQARAGVRSARRYVALIVFLLYTGCRISEAIKLRPEDLELQRAFAFVGKTKNGKPRPVHLPPQVVAELANIEFGKQRVFGIATRNTRLYLWLNEIAAAAGVHIPDGVGYHAFRHTYGAWMRRYAGLDTSGLVGTGAWKSRNAAAIYEHVEASEEARKADMLPWDADLGAGWEMASPKANKVNNDAVF